MADRELEQIIKQNCGPFAHEEQFVRKAVNAAYRLGCQSRDSEIAEARKQAFRDAADLFMSIHLESDDDIYAAIRALAEKE